MALPHQNYTESQLFRVSVVRYDGVLRMQVPSRRKKTPPYLVQLDSYDGNGECQCRDFVTRREPLLKRGFTAEQAVAAELIHIPPWGTVEDALRCFHIHVARLKFADDTIKAIHDAQETHSNPE